MRSLSPFVKAMTAAKDGTKSAKIIMSEVKKRCVVCVHADLLGGGPSVRSRCTGHREARLPLPCS
jgi:hypothetical protein